MITLTAIQKAIADKIRFAFSKSEFKNIPIVSSDEEEPILRPSIKIFLEDTESYRFSKMKEKTLTYRVYFFASDINKYKVENLKASDILEKEFLKPLKLNENCYIEIENFRSTVTDTVLLISFELNTLEEIEDDLFEEIIFDDDKNSEKIEELNLKIKEETND